MVALGKLMNPMTGKLERNLEAAKNTIDTLGAIEARTRGNLEPDEQRVLAQVLTDLRMNYVDELKKGGAGPDRGAPRSRRVLERLQHRALEVVRLGHREQLRVVRRLAAQSSTRNGRRASRADSSSTWRNSASSR